jgi:GH24 family phage-related lysozyme (muramidase)
MRQDREATWRDYIWFLPAAAILVGIVTGRCDKARDSFREFVNSRKKQEIEVLIDSPIPKFPTERENTEQEENYEPEKKEQAGETLYDIIKRHEGWEPYSYPDRNGRSIGAGFYLDNPDSRELIESLGLDYDKVYSGKQALTDEQIDFLLRRRIADAEQDAVKYLGKKDYEELDEKAKKVLVDMMFQMGYPKMKAKYVDFKQALIKEDYQWAAEEMRYKHDKKDGTPSDWFTQTPNRAGELIEMMRSIGE